MFLLRHGQVDGITWLSLPMIVAFALWAPTDLQKSIQAAEGKGPLVPVILQIIAEDNEQPLPCHVYLSDAAGQPLQPSGYPFWIDHFACDSAVELRLKEGEYAYDLDRGPEYALAKGSLQVSAGQSLRVTHRLMRLANLAAEGWYSGETHVHRPPEQIEQIMRAADLHVAELITW